MRRPENYFAPLPWDGSVVDLVAGTPNKKHAIPVVMLANASYITELFIAWCTAVVCFLCPFLLVMAATAAPIPSQDLPIEPVVRPSDYPDWGEVYVPPAQLACNESDVPTVRYAGTTK